MATSIEMRERKLNDIVTLIQKVYRSWKTRKYFLELREKSLGLFGRNKPRRRASIRRYYVGDYLNISTHPAIQAMLAKYVHHMALVASPHLILVIYGFVGY
jgi:myosin-1